MFARFVEIPSMTLRNICLVHMNVFAKFDEILSMILQDIKETKRYRRTVRLSFGRTDRRTTVYPPTNIVCGGYNEGTDKLHTADQNLCSW